MTAPAPPPDPAAVAREIAAAAVACATAAERSGFVFLAYLLHLAAEEAAVRAADEPPAIN